MNDDEEMLIMNGVAMKFGLKMLGVEELVQLEVGGVGDAAGIGQHVDALLRRVLRLKVLGVLQIHCRPPEAGLGVTQLDPVQGVVGPSGSENGGFRKYDHKHNFYTFNGRSPNSNCK